jgi:hypothetical protein
VIGRAGGQARLAAAGRLGSLRCTRVAAVGRAGLWVSVREARVGRGRSGAGDWSGRSPMGWWGCTIARACSGGPCFFRGDGVRSDLSGRRLRPGNRARTGIYGKPDSVTARILSGGLEAAVIRPWFYISRMTAFGHADDGAPGSPSGLEQEGRRRSVAPSPYQRFSRRRMAHEGRHRRRWGRSSAVDAPHSAW